MYRVSPENPGKLSVIDANGGLMATFEPKFTFPVVDGEKTISVVLHPVVEDGYVINNVSTVSTELPG